MKRSMNLEKGNELSKKCEITIDEWLFRFTLTDTSLQILGDEDEKIQSYLAMTYTKDNLPIQIKYVCDDDLCEVFLLLADTNSENLRVSGNSILIRNTMIRKQKWIQLPLERKQRSELEQSRLENINLSKKYQKLYSSHEKLKKMYFILQSKYKLSKNQFSSDSQDYFLGQEVMESNFLNTCSTFKTQIQQYYGNAIIMDDFITYQSSNRYSIEIDADEQSLIYSSIPQKQESLGKVDSRIRFIKKYGISMHQSSFLTFGIIEPSEGMVFGLTSLDPASFLSLRDSDDSSDCISIKYKDNKFLVIDSNGMVNMTSSTFDNIKDCILVIFFNQESQSLRFYIEKQLIGEIDAPEWLLGQGGYAMIFFKMGTKLTKICPNMKFASPLFQEEYQKVKRQNQCKLNAS